MLLLRRSLLRLPTACAGYLRAAIRWRPSFAHRAAQIACEQVDNNNTPHNQYMALTRYGTHTMSSYHHHHTQKYITSCFIVLALKFVLNVWMRRALSTGQRVIVGWLLQLLSLCLNSCGYHLRDVWITVKINVTKTIILDQDCSSNTSVGTKVSDISITMITHKNTLNILPYCLFIKKVKWKKCQYILSAYHDRYQDEMRQDEMREKFQYTDNTTAFYI